VHTDLEKLEGTLASSMCKAFMHHGQNRGEQKKRKLGKKLNENRGTFIHFVKIGGFIDFVEIGSIFNMHHWLKGYG